MVSKFNSVKLSVCVPTYNRPEQFKRMLSGLLPQITDEIEIVVRDDSTTDKSKEIFDLMIADKNICYQYFSGEKIGLDAASLFLFEHAIGEFVWLFSDDDEILSGSILEVNKLITSDPNLNLVWANFDSDLPGGLAVKNRNSGYFRDGSEALEVIGTGIGLVSTQIFRRKQGLLGFEIAKRHIVGFSFASTAVYLSVLAGPGKFYFMNGPCFICHPTKPDEIFEITNKTGKIVNEGFNVYGIHFLSIVKEFEGSFKRRSIRKLLAENFGELWRGMLVGWVRGWDTPSGKRLLMFKYYWSFPEFWLAIIFFLLPLSVNKILYKLYKLFFIRRRFKYFV